MFEMKAFPGPSAQHACGTGMGRASHKHQNDGGPRTLLYHLLGLAEHPAWDVVQGWRGITPRKRRGHAGTERCRPPKVEFRSRSHCPLVLFLPSHDLRLKL